MVPSGRGLLVVTKATFILVINTDANGRECLKHPKFSNLVQKNFQVLANQQQARPMQISKKTMTSRIINEPHKISRFFNLCTLI